MAGENAELIRGMGGGQHAPVGEIMCRPGAMRLHIFFTASVNVALKKSML